MTPYYQDDLVTLYHGDCMELAPRVLGAEPIAAVIADPPYGETALAWDRWPAGWATLAASIAPVLWCFGSFRMFWDQRDEFTPWRYVQDLVWEKHNGSASNADRFRRVHELPVQFCRKDVKWEEVYKKPVYTYDATKRAVKRQVGPRQWRELGEHRYASEEGGPRLQRSVIFARSCHHDAVNETQKPEAIVRPLVEYSVPPGGVLVSLFAGSGTDLAVAREQGKRAIGFEMRESQCAEISARLAQRLLLST